MKPRKPIRHTSTARAREVTRYRKVVKDFLDANSVCFRCGAFVLRPDRQNHHLYGRVGRLLTWEPGFRMACPLCHTWIHLHPKKAIDRGQLAPMGTFNDYQRAVAYESNRTNPT